METELFASVEAGDLAKFQELIKKETKETIDQVDFYGYTALHAAAENGRLEMIPALLEAGADINRATYDATFTSLHHALAKGHMECARLLVERGADVNVLNEGGCFGSSLFYAVYRNDPEFVKYLIGKGADVNCISGQGYACLHQAAMSDFPEICKILIDHGADVNVQDEEELTPLHCAARDGYGECVMILCKAGADCYKTNNEGKTAKDLADMATEAETVEYLAKCETGLVGDEAPKKKERAPIQHKEIVVPAGWGPG